MSTPTPDEKNGTGPGGDKAPGASGATASVEDTIVTRATGDAPPRGQGAQPDAASRSAGGPPPPWQRANTREAGARPGPEPEGQGPAEPGTRESGGRPPTGPMPTQGARTPATGTPDQGNQGGRTSGPSSGPLPMAGGDQRSRTAMIDAPTNQLSPEQLGMRNRGRSEPEADFDDLDDDAGAPSSRPSRGKVPRRASLQVKRFDPWSVLKLALVLGVALFFVWMFAVGVLYAVLDGMGVWAQLNGTYQDLTSDGGGGGGQLITAGGVFGVAAIIGVVNTILFTALASVSAFIYNISADVAGGIEVTLSERD